MYFLVSFLLFPWLIGRLDLYFGYFLFPLSRTGLWFGAVFGVLYFFPSPVLFGTICLHRFSSSLFLTLFLTRRCVISPLSNLLYLIPFIGFYA